MFSKTINHCVKENCQDPCTRGTHDTKVAWILLITSNDLAHFKLLPLYISDLVFLDNFEWPWNPCIKVTWFILSTHMLPQYFKTISSAISRVHHTVQVLLSSCTQRNFRTMIWIMWPCRFFPPMWPPSGLTSKKLSPEYNSTGSEYCILGYLSGLAIYHTNVTTGQPAIWRSFPKYNATDLKSSVSPETWTVTLESLSTKFHHWLV